MLLPQSLPDETVCSRLIRYRLCSGKIQSQFLRPLFGKHKIVLHPYLTAYLEDIARTFGEDADNIIEKQTLFPIFAFYLPQYSEAIKQAQLGNNGALVLRECQLPSFKGKVPFVIKSCPICVKQDIYDHGVAYWHRTHQIPGITACAKHKVLLTQIDLGALLRLHYDFLPQLTQDIVSAPKKEILLANFSVELLSLLETSNRIIPMTEIYRDKLAKLGFVTKQARIRREKLMKCFVDFWQDLTRRSNSIFPASFNDYGFLRGLLDNKSPQHPFKHLLFASWLFDSPDELFLTLEPESERKTVCNNLNLNEPKDLEISILNLLQSGYSQAEVSRLTGKSRCYLKRIAALNGTNLNLHPKSLTTSVKKEILQFAESGVHRALIASKLNISIGSVEQEISNCPGLVKRRKRCHFESKRRKCRVKIAQYIRINPHVLRKDVKQYCNAEFYWLYQNDRNWLEENLPVAMKAKQHSSVDWQQRDIELSEKVKDLLSSLDEAVSRTALDKLLGGHGWLIKHRNKLPLTMAAYEAFNY